MDGRGEQSLTGFIITADRGYGKYALLKGVLKDTISYIFVMPQHITGCHPFVGLSFPNVHRDYDSDSSSEVSSESDCEISPRNGINSDSDQDMPHTVGQSGASVSTGRQVNGESEMVVDESATATGANSATRSAVSSADYDRLKRFIFNDGPTAGPAVWFARERGKFSSNRALPQRPGVCVDQQ